MKLSYKEQHNLYLPLIFLKSLQRLVHDCPSVGADVTPVGLQQFIGFSDHERALYNNQTLPKMHLILHLDRQVIEVKENTGRTFKG